MFKLYFLYLILRLITGNPIVAIIAVVVIYYAIDRRFIGLLPSLVKPLKRRMRLASLRKQIQLNPHDMPAKYDLAQGYMERKRFADALVLIEELSEEMKATADVMYDIGVCKVYTGQVGFGCQLIQEALAKNPVLRYGEPYLTLARIHKEADPAHAIEYLQEFQKHNFSSCEAYYTLAQLHLLLGNRSVARQCLDECVDTYRALPRFRKKHERVWATRARVKRIMM